MMIIEHVLKFYRAAIAKYREVLKENVSAGIYIPTLPYLGTYASDLVLKKRYLNSCRKRMTRP